MFEPPVASIQIALSPSTTLACELLLPSAPLGWVLFARGGGGARLGPRDRQLARRLHRARIATVLTDLLTPQEDEDEARRLDSGLLAERLLTVAQWLRTQEVAAGLPLGVLGGGSGAAAALRAAAVADSPLDVLVLRGGLTQLAGGPEVVGRVRAPTLLLVGGHDPEVLEANRLTHQQLTGPRRLHIVQGATHLFEEAGALDEVALEATNWFVRHFGK
jgi:pimeloyl-ACP methyl ester carboxylesterase